MINQDFESYKQQKLSTNNLIVYMPNWNVIKYASGIASIKYKK
jgi:hypothetical protein